MSHDLESTAAGGPEGAPAAEPPPPPIGLPAAGAGGPERLEAAVAAGFAELKELFDQKIHYDRFKEDQITRIHAELQAHKADLIARACLPLINGLIRLHDDLGKLLETARPSGTEAMTPEQAVRALGHLAEDIETLLGDHGVSAYREPHDAFDPHRQRALRTVPAPDPERVGRVAQRLRPGFERAGGIVVKERVAVYVAAPAPGPSAPPDGERT